MNTNHDELERLLGDELRDRAGDMGGARLQLTDVRGRARSIRRTRVVAGTLGAAAAVAVIAVPLVTVAGSVFDADTAPPVTSPTVTESDAVAPVDPHPPLAWAIGNRIYPLDGEGEPFVPQLDMSEGMSFARFGDQWVIGTYTDGGFQLSVVDGTGRVVRSFEAGEGSGVVSNAAGTAFTWLDPDGSAQLLTVGADQPTVLPGELPGPAGMTTLTGLYGEDCSTDCELLFEVYVDDHSETYRMSLDGQPERILEDLVSFTDLSPDGTLATGMTSLDEMNQSSCSAVVDIESGEQLWETCEAGSLRFSPDGAHVLANDPWLDGANHSTWMVLDAADGSEVRSGEGVIYDESWETDTTWLVVRGDSETDQASIDRYELGTQQPDQVVTSQDTQIDGSGFHLERR